MLNNLTALQPLLVPPGLEEQNLHMFHPYPAGSLLLLLSFIPPFSEMPRQSTPKAPMYDTSKWTLVKKNEAVFDRSQQPAEVLLLKSAGESGRSGADYPLNDVQLVVAKGGQVIYDYVQQGRDNNRFFMDDALTVQDVTGGGVPEIIFHSGTRGASD